MNIKTITWQDLEDNRPDLVAAIRDEWRQKRAIAEREKEREKEMTEKKEPPTDEDYEQAIFNKDGAACNVEREVRKSERRDRVRRAAKYIETGELPTG